MIVAIGVLGLLLAGAGLGRLLLPGRTVVEEIVAAPPAASADPSAGAERRAVPDVVGLPLEVARTAFADAGYTVELQQRPRPAAGPPGRILEQDPVGGTDAATAGGRSEFALTVSAPVDLPQLRGKTVAEARAQLQSLGAIPEVVAVIDGREPAGTVLATEPAAGVVTPTRVTLRVADGGAVLPLADLPEADSNSCSTGENVSVDGRVVGNSPTCSPYAGGDAAYAEYVLGRHALFLQGRFGTNDAGGRGSATIRVLDEQNRLLKKVEVRLADHRTVRIKVAGVLRLRIEVRTESTDAEPDVVLGNARLIGQPDQIDQIPVR